MLPALFANPTVDFIFLAPLCLIVLDLLSGITRATHDGHFQFRRLADFLGASFFHYVVATAAIIFLWFVSGSFQAVIVAGSLGMATLSASVGASILENLSLSGLPPTLQNDVKEIVGEAEKVEGSPPPTKSPMVTESTDPRLTITHIQTQKLRAWRAQ